MTGSGTAVVTGATAGIGAAFARRLAAEGYDLVLVARDATRLTGVADELTARHGVTATALPADLSTVDGCVAVERRLTDPAHPVDLLINNAGFSLNRSFLRSSVEDEERLLRLNVFAVMRLTHAVLPTMVARGTGGVVNVSSASAFAPVMPGSTYPPSKAWVTSFSESLAPVARRHGVTVMALCPGYTRTEFHQRQGIDMSGTPDWIWLDADAVVRDALRDLRRGRTVSVPDWRYKAAVFLMRHAPRRVFARLAPDRRGLATPSPTDKRRDGDAE
ncbi:MAG TPA: SDR family oxidoreductase [Micromonosporaceae bacterium]